MVDTDAGAVVISVNGQVPDGEDLSWLWDVNFEHFVDHPVVAAGERGTDLFFFFAASRSVKYVLLFRG